MIAQCWPEVIFNPTIATLAESNSTLYLTGREVGGKVKWQGWISRAVVSEVDVYEGVSELQYLTCKLKRTRGCMLGPRSECV